MLCTLSLSFAVSSHVQETVHGSTACNMKLWCILALQGSGKSNLMDAISFVLGVRTAHLRGSLKELIYSNSVEKSEILTISCQM